jgi:hypothetical protein
VTLNMPKFFCTNNLLFHSNSNYIVILPFGGWGVGPVGVPANQLKGYSGTLWPP